MTNPSHSDLFDTLDATWPALRFLHQPPWMVREGAGGGQRVCAATATGPVEPRDIPTAETAMRNLGQHPLFMIRPGDDALDGWLADRAYDVVDPVAIYLCALQPTAKTQAADAHLVHWPPTEGACEVWRKGGIGPARIEVMSRVAGKKTALLATQGDEPIGVAFVALHGQIAMLHALEVSPEYRRLGVGRNLMAEARDWALDVSAMWLSLMVTRANAPANALYRLLGMSEVGQYHYRRAPKV